MKNNDQLSLPRILGYRVARELTPEEVSSVTGGGQPGCGENGQETTWCSGTGMTYQDDCR